MEKPTHDDPAAALRDAALCFESCSAAECDPPRAGEAIAARVRQMPGAEQPPFHAAALLFADRADDDRLLPN
jgi:hypothetical protein